MSSSTSDSLIKAELEAMEMEIEEESKKLKEIQNEMNRKLQLKMPAEKEEMDGRSVYVGNVDYTVTSERLQKHFEACGTINRVSIQTNKFTRQPMGFAYVEFQEKAGMEAALELTDSLLAGRQIKVVAKRTNKPGIGRGGSARGAARGARGARGATRGGGGVVVKYVYIDAPSGRGAAPRGRRGFGNFRSYHHTPY